METFIIAGLGNPGPEYAKNRHNVGFLCLGRVAAAQGLAFDERRKKARVARGTIRERRVVLAQPQTFMNDSGRAIGPLARFYRVPPERILVVYDDLDLPLGTLRIRPQGGSGGHKGVRSIIRHLGSQEFPRLRIGIDRPPGRMDPAAYVLQDFSEEELPLLEETLERAVAAVETWLCDGTEMAMTHHNRSL